MKFQQLTYLFVIALAPTIKARDDDQFNYRTTVNNPYGGGKDYGPGLWDGVTCDHLGTCVSQKTAMELSLKTQPLTYTLRCHTQ